MNTNHLITQNSVLTDLYFLSSAGSLMLSSNLFPLVNFHCHFSQVLLYPFTLSPSPLPHRRSCTLRGASFRLSLILRHYQEGISLISASPSVPLIFCLSTLVAYMDSWTISWLIFAPHPTNSDFLKVISSSVTCITCPRLSCIPHYTHYSTSLLILFLFLYTPCILPPPARISACSVSHLRRKRLQGPPSSLSYSPFHLYPFLLWPL